MLHSVCYICPAYLISGGLIFILEARSKVRDSADKLLALNPTVITRNSRRSGFKGKTLHPRLADSDWLAEDPSGLVDLAITGRANLLMLPEKVF